MSKSSFNHSNVDRVGVCVSAAWAVHCAIVPFGATTLPLLGIGFIADERIERINLPILDILDESSHRVPGHSGNDRQREPARVSNKVWFGLVNVTVKISFPPVLRDCKPARGTLSHPRSLEVASRWMIEVRNVPAYGVHQLADVGHFLETDLFDGV
jgi:hypothetical protein